MLNVAAFIGSTIVLHGDAINGKRIEDRYYLYGFSAELGRKDYHEVPREVYMRSLYLARIAIVSGLLVPMILFMQGRLLARRDAEETKS